MSRIPTATSRIPTKSGTATSNSFTTISRPTNGSILLSTRSAGHAEPKKDAPGTISSRSYDADGASTGSSGSAGGAIREFVANTTIHEPLLANSIQRGVNADSKGAFQVEETVTRKSSELPAPGSSSSSLLLRKTTGGASTSSSIKPPLISARGSNSFDNDNSSVNSSGSGGVTRTTGLPAPPIRTARVTTTALAATVSSALQSVKDISDGTKLISTRPASGSFLAKNVPGSLMPKPVISRTHEELHVEKIPGVSREKQVIMGGKSTIKNVDPETISESISSRLDKPILDQDVDNLDLKTFLSIFSMKSSDHTTRTFIAAKDMSSEELQQVIDELSIRIMKDNDNILGWDDSKLGQYIDESDWICERPYKIKLSTVWREHYSMDIIENLSSFYDMTREQ